MGSPLTAEFAIGHRESLSFARLSGDFNPLHLDPVVARRTQFGQTVVHGIHGVLKALDELDPGIAIAACDVLAISCTFHTPMATGARVRTTATPDEASGRVRVVGESEERLAFSAVVSVRRGQSHIPGSFADAEFEPATPRIGALPDPQFTGEVPLRLSGESLSSLFPRLARTADPDWIANLMATTHIVGMECPGMHSILAGVKLRHVESPAGHASRRMRYTVEKSDRRFRSVRLGVASGTFEGSIEAFLRAPFTDQMSLADVCDRVSGGAFAGQRALVIGGSRGLGEATAKILLAGGAEVTITYATGRDDADRIAAEAARLGRECEATRLDVTSVTDAASLGSLAESGFSHVYYFASPNIARNADRWRQDLFDRFCGVYVRAFDSVAEALLRDATLRKRPPARFLYPSTIFLDHPEPGFVEYCAAKAAGEALCAHLAHKYGTVFARPRLPRMRTDQTSALMEASHALEPFSVLHPILIRLHADPSALAA